MAKIKGKKQMIYITGSSHRIGLFLTKSFLSEDFKVLASTRKASKELLDLKNENLVILEENIIENSSLAVNYPVEHFVHCASIYQYDSVSITNIDSIRLHNRINNEFFTETCLLLSKQKQENMSCTAFIDQKVKNLNPEYFSYTLSKLSLESSIRFLAQALAPMRINAISPGLTLPSGQQTEKDFENLVAEFPVGHSNSLDDLFQTAKFLVTQKSITGQNIVVDGGQHLMFVPENTLKEKK